MKWDLTYHYKTEEEFEAALKNMNSFIEKFASYKGKLANEEDFKEYFLLVRDFNEAFSRLYQYASLRSDLNKKDVKNAAALNRVEMIYYTISEVTSFEQPEVLALGYDKVMSYVDHNEELEEFRFSFIKLFHAQEHVLDAKSETLLSYFSQLGETGASLYSSLAVADGKPKEVKLSTKEVVSVTQGNYISLILKSKNPKDRQKIFDALYQNYQDHENTYADIYKSVLNADKAYAKARNYENSLEAHLFGNNIPTSVYKNLVEVASTKNKALKKYIKLRKKALGLKQYHTYDRFLQLATSDKEYSYEDSKELFFNSIKQFPADFQEKAHEVLRDGFVDVYEQPGKRSGAYSSSMVNMHPFILLNHDNTLDSAFTLAHEAGHSIHSMYSCETQPTMLQDYTIFVAEIASTFNEHNLLDYFLNSENPSKDEKIMVLQKAIDEIVGTFYRQTLFAEYELIAHQKNEAGEPINHEVLSAIMIDLYKKYYGLDITKEELKKYVWAYIPHLFYTPFYVYQYATSFAASFKLYKDVKDKVPGAFDKYINLLKAGGSKYPMEEVLEAGVDFTKKDAFMAVVERMDYLVDELESLLK